jgi:surface antigen
MDSIGYAFKFSTELIVLILSLAVIGTNFAGNANLQSLTSNNLLAKELSYRSGLNKLLYNKTTAVTTVVTGSNAFISSASAQVVLASDQLTSAGSDLPQNSAVSDNAITAEYPDNVKDLIANQIQSYSVQAGDTLQSLATKFNISQNTIKWANNLSSSKVAPGTNLVILPVDGVLHKMGANDTLPDVAKAYNADLNKIISFNGLADSSDTQQGDVIIVPDGIVPAPAAPIAKPAAVAKHVIKGKTVYEPVVNLTPSSGHLFPVGQCTYYVAFRRDALGKPVTWGGNAKAWLKNAAAAGAETGHTPTPGAIAEMKDGNRRYGHVALVEQVQGDEVTVSEMNYEGWGITDKRTVNINDISAYIY